MLPYTHGLIAGNFVSIVNRFASLLEFIVQTYNDDGLIDFGAPEAVSAMDLVVDIETGRSTVNGCTDGSATLLGQLGRRWMGVSSVFGLRQLV